MNIYDMIIVIFLLLFFQIVLSKDKKYIVFKNIKKD